MKRTLRKPSTGSNKNRPHGRMRQVVLDGHGRVRKLAQPSQGRGISHSDDIGPNDPRYKPARNKPCTNSDLIRDALKSRVGIQMPAPLTRQQRRRNAILSWKADCREVAAQNALDGLNRPKRENISHSTRASRRRKREEA